MERRDWKLKHFFLKCVFLLCNLTSKIQSNILTNLCLQNNLMSHSTVSCLAELTKVYKQSWFTCIISERSHEQELILNILWETDRIQPFIESLILLITALLRKCFRLFFTNWYYWLSGSSSNGWYELIWTEKYLLSKCNQISKNKHQREYMAQISCLVVWWTSVFFPQEDFS